MESLKILRKEKGFSLMDLSKITKIHHKRLNRLEQGKKPRPDETKALKKAFSKKRPAPNCLKLLRELAGLKQREAGSRAGMSQQRISEAERGLCKLSLTELQRLSEVYNINNIESKGNHMLQGQIETLKLPRPELIKKINADPDFHLAVKKWVLSHLPKVKGSKTNPATGEVTEFETPDTSVFQGKNEAEVLADLTAKIIKNGRV